MKQRMSHLYNKPVKLKAIKYLSKTNCITYLDVSHNGTITPEKV